MKVKAFSRDKEISTPSPWLTAPNLSGLGKPTMDYHFLPGKCSVSSGGETSHEVVHKTHQSTASRGRDSYVFTLPWNTTDHMPHLALALALTLNYSDSPVWKNGWSYPQDRWPVLSGRTVIFCHPVPSLMGFPGGSMVKNLPTNAGNAGDTSLIPGSRRSPGEWNGNPLQYSCLGNPMDRGAWRAIVHGVPKSQKDWVTEHTGMCLLYHLFSPANWHAVCQREKSAPTV